MLNFICHPLRTEISAGQRFAQAEVQRYITEL